MTKNRKKSHFLFLSFLLQGISFNAYSSPKSSKLINRLLININKSQYTQRELEIYILVKKISEEKEDLYPITTQNWDLFLKEFSTDFLIYQTAREIAFYGKTKNKKEEWKSFLEKVKISQREYTTIKEKILELNPSQNEFQRFFTSYQIIMNYIKRRKNTDNIYLYGDKKPFWLLRLEREGSIRFYKHSGLYEPSFSL